MNDNPLAEGYYCTECAFFEEVNLVEGENCPACGDPYGDHIDAVIMEKK